MMRRLFRVLRYTQGCAWVTTHRAQIGLPIHRERDYTRFN